jgi:hypothetical protein
MPQPSRATRRAAERRTAGSSGNKFAFDADAKTQSRREAPVTIGEQVYHRRLKDNEVSRQARDIAREQNVANRRAALARKAVDDLSEDEIDEWERLEGEADQYDDEALEKTYELVALLLEDAEGKNPDLAVLRTKIDIEVIGELAGALVSGGEPVSGPTPTPTSSG